MKIDLDSAEVTFTICAIMKPYEKTFNWNKKRVEWDLNHQTDNGSQLLCTPVDEPWILYAYKNKLSVL